MDNTNLLLIPFSASATVDGGRSRQSRSYMATQPLMLLTHMAEPPKRLRYASPIPTHHHHVAPHLDVPSPARLLHPREIASKRMHAEHVLSRHQFTRSETPTTTCAGTLLDITHS